jgi:hypothetical protein
VNASFVLPKAGLIGNEKFVLYTLKNGKKQKVKELYSSYTRSPVLETFGNINFGEKNLSDSRVIKAISTEGEFLNFKQYTTAQGYDINITFTPFSSSEGNTISSSNLKIKKLTQITENGERITGEFAFQDNIPKQVLSVDTHNRYKTYSYKISPEDIELTIPTDFVPSSNGSEEFISTITYSAVTVP